MEIVELMSLHTKLFSLQYKLDKNPSSLILKKDIQIVEDLITKAYSKYPRFKYKTSVNARASNLILKKPWSRLNSQLKADRLYVYCMALKIDKKEKKQLYQIFKRDLEKKILSKKKEVIYDSEETKITEIPRLKFYLDELNIEYDNVLQPTLLDN